MPKQYKIDRATSGATEAIKDSKNAHLERLVSRRKGVAITELEQRLGWQSHTVRAAISRLRKSGMIITCTKSSAGPVYKLQPSTVGRA